MSFWLSQSSRRAYRAGAAVLVATALGSLPLAGPAGALQRPGPASSSSSAPTTSACTVGTIPTCHYPNWAGEMVVLPGTVPVAKFVATFPVARLDCALSPSRSRLAEWVGFGGVQVALSAPDNLVQAGVQGICTNGTASYSAFWEYVNTQLPANDEQGASPFPPDHATAPLVVRPGQFVHVQIWPPRYSGSGYWTISFSISSAEDAGYVSTTYENITNAVRVGATAEVVYETPVIGTNKYGDAVESPLAQFGYACCANGSLLLGRGGSGLDYAEYNVVKGALIEPTPLPAGLPAKLEAYQLVMERGQTTLANVAFGGRDQTDFYVRWVASGGLWG